MEIAEKLSYVVSLECKLISSLAQRVKVPTIDTIEPLSNRAPSIWRTTAQLGGQIGGSQ